MKNNYLRPRFPGISAYRFVVFILLIINNGVLYADGLVSDQKESDQKEIKITGKVSSDDGMPLHGGKHNNLRDD